MNAPNPHIVLELLGAFWLSRVLWLGIQIGLAGLGERREQRRAAANSLPCVGCGKPVGQFQRVEDRHGWWHRQCEYEAWVNADIGAPMVAPFAKEFRVARATRAWRLR